VAAAYVGAPLGAISARSLSDNLKAWTTVEALMTAPRRPIS
jgi:precorrin-3B methylase